jgi:hypothetical protein
VDGLELIRDLRGEMSRATQNRRASQTVILNERRFHRE